MQANINQKLDLLKEEFGNFTKLPFPDPVDEIDQEKDPHGALLYLDEDIAVAILSWLEPSHSNKMHSRKKKNLTKEINNTEKVIKRYKAKNNHEIWIIKTMLTYLSKIKKLYDVYLSVCNS